MGLSEHISWRFVFPEKEVQTSKEGCAMNPKGPFLLLKYLEYRDVAYDCYVCPEPKF